LPKRRLKRWSKTPGPPTSTWRAKPLKPSQARASSSRAPDPTSATAPVADANDRWVDDVGREFEPVSKNLSQAFQFLLEAVPADKAPAT
jgi:hypothetical protein